MSKLYKKVKLLVSRQYHHGGDGLERMGLVFFRSIEEYDKLSAKYNWETGKSFGTSWCVRPTEIEALVYPGDYAKFIEGKNLPAEKVFFSSKKVDEVYNVGRW